MVGPWGTCIQTDMLDFKPQAPEPTTLSAVGQWISGSLGPSCLLPVFMAQGRAQNQKRKKVSCQVKVL